MAQHECETFDFPLKEGSFEFVRVSRRTVADIQQVLTQAKEEAETKGNDAMKDETCASPCERIIYVDISIDSVEILKPEGIVPLPGGIGGYTSVVVQVRWQAGILCYKKAEPKSIPKTSGAPKGDSKKD
jgi:hypothetical protein